MRKINFINLHFDVVSYSIFFFKRLGKNIFRTHISYLRGSPGLVLSDQFFIVVFRFFRVVVVMEQQPVADLPGLVGFLRSLRVNAELMKSRPNSDGKSANSEPSVPIAVTSMDTILRSTTCGSPKLHLRAPSTLGSPVKVSRLSLIYAALGCSYQLGVCQQSI